MFHFHRQRANDLAMAALSGNLESLCEDGGNLWQSHWFTIEGPTLNWYTNEKRSDKLGTFQLATLHRVERHHDGAPEIRKVYLHNADRDLALRARSGHELEMWIRAIELYADLARGGDGNGIVNVPEPVAAFRKKHFSFDESHDTEEKKAETREGEARTVIHVDRSDVKEHGHTIVRHVAEEKEEEEEFAESKSSDRFEDGAKRISVKCKLAANPFSFRPEAESGRLGSFTEYDETHHLVTHHNVDTGVTTFSKDGTMHTNFYF